MTLPVALRERLRTTYGLDTSTVGEATLRSAWQRRREASGVQTTAEFEALLSRSADEFDALVEEVLVPESWFFRDGVPFAYLETWARDYWKAHAQGRVLRVLSVPCAAGQEAWSIAMTLLDAGLVPGEFLVCAGDLSKIALERARAGIYPDSAFRGGSTVGREHHFESAGPNLRRVRANVRGSVEWRRCNLNDPLLFIGEAPFEVVFCRNALIYFDVDARRRALASLSRCLVPGGLFFAGHADGQPLLDADFIPAGPPGAFAFQLGSA